MALHSRLLPPATQVKLEVKALLKAPSYARDTLRSCGVNVYRNRPSEVRTVKATRKPVGAHLTSNMRPAGTPSADIRQARVAASVSVHSASKNQLGPELKVGVFGGRDQLREYQKNTTK